MINFQLCFLYKQNTPGPHMDSPRENLGIEATLKIWIAHIWSIQYRKKMETERSNKL